MLIDACACLLQGQTGRGHLLDFQKIQHTSVIAKHLWHLLPAMLVHTSLFNRGGAIHVRHVVPSALPANQLQIIGRLFKPAANNLACCCLALCPVLPAPSRFCLSLSVFQYWWQHTSSIPWLCMACQQQQTWAGLSVAGQLLTLKSLERA